MDDRAAFGGIGKVPPLAIAAAAAAIFALDANTQTSIAVSVLYVVIVLMTAGSARQRTILLVAIGCAALTVTALFVAPEGPSLSVAILNHGLSIAANAITTFLVLRARSADTQLRERASLLELSHDAVFSLDMGSVILSWNRAAEDLYGWTSQEAVGRNVHDLLQTTFPEPLEDLHATLHSTGRWEGKLLHQKRDGTRVIAASRWSLHRDRQGQPVAILETNNDITDRTRAIEALEQSERRYRGIFNRMPCAFWEVEAEAFVDIFERLRADGVTSLVDHARDHPDFGPSLHEALRITDVNDEAVRMLGARDRNDLIGPLARVWPDQRGILEAANTLYQGGASYKRLSKITTLDGREIDVLRTSIYIDDLSQSGSVMTGAIDITEQRRASEELARSEAKYRNLFEHLPIAVVQTDTSQLLAEFARLHAEGVTDLDRYIDDHPDFLNRVAGLVRVTQINAEAVKLFGPETAAEFMGNIGRFFAADQGTMRRNAVARFSGEESITEEMRTVTLDGRTVHLLYKNTFSRTLSEMGIGLLAMIDITERRQAQESLQQAQSDLERFNRVMLMGEMTASISHEINQPISGAITNANAACHWLAADPPNVEEVRKSLERIVNDGHRASDVIARVRALATKTPPHKGPLDINQAVQEVLALADRELQNNSVKLQVRLSHDLPLISADRVQVQQVILNLVANAIEAMSATSPGERRLSVMTGPDSSDAFVEVRDTGAGLEAAESDRLFQSFYTTKEGGMGMGLSLSRAIVEAHGGRLSVVPNEPSGAIFRFTLPVIDPSPADQDA